MVHFFIRQIHKQNNTSMKKRLNKIISLFKKSKKEEIIEEPTRRKGPLYKYRTKK